jgi:hypothetical protein
LSHPQFLADAAKLGVEVQHVGGAAIHALPARIYASPPELIEQARGVPAVGQELRGSRLAVALLRG